MESFIVRVWIAREPTESDEVLRGVVEHVGSGRTTTFADEVELLAFLHEAERELTAARQVGGDPWSDEEP